MKKTIQCHSTKTSDLIKIPIKNGNYTKVKSISDIHNYNSKNKKSKNQNQGITLINDKKKYILFNHNILNPNKLHKPNPLFSSLYNKTLNKNNIQIQKNLKTNTYQNRKANLQYKFKKHFPKVTIDIDNKISTKNTSYSKTAASTGNNYPNDNIKTPKIESIFKHLIQETNLKDTQSISKIECLKNNIFLIKIYSFISNLISKNYKLKELENNIELKNQFHNFENKLDLLTNSKRNNINIINADLFDDLYTFNNGNNNILHRESNTRKLIYKTFFEFFDEILNDIVKLANELQNQNNLSDNRTSLKKLDDLTSKISSLHSKINLSKNNNFDNLDSPVFSTVSLKNNFIDEDNNYFFGIEKEGSQLISSFDSDFYQQILKKTFNKESSNSLHNKVKKIYLNKKKNESKNFSGNKSSSSSTLIQNDDFSDTEIIVNDSEFGTIHSESFNSNISKRSNSNKQSKKSIKRIYCSRRNEFSKEHLKNSIRNIPIQNTAVNNLSKKNISKKITPLNPIINEKKSNNCQIF